MGEGNMKKLPSIALGTWSWGAGFAGGDQVFGNKLSTEDIKPVFDAAMKNGLNLWDTAAVYGMGSSEAILGEFVRQYPREDIVLSTKFTPQIAGTAKDAVEEMLKASLQRLGTDYIDIYWIHNPADVKKWTPGLIPFLKSGKVKRVGVSNHNLEEIKLANSILAKEGYGISAVQNHYSLLYRSSEKAGIIDYCKENNAAFFAYMVLEQGALSGKYDAKHPLPAGSARAETYNKILPQLEALTGVMKDIGRGKNASIAQVAIAWAIAKSTLPIIGVTKVSQVEDAVSAAKLTLTAEEVKKIEGLAAKAGVDTKGSWEKPMV
jgi:aryl-alcohol dehydrogenase-like predicted oxidoreductase